MAYITIAGCDPSMNNFGFCKGKIDLDSGVFSLEKILLSQAPPESKNKSVRKNSQDLSRARIHTEATRAFLKDVDVVCVEIPVGSQSARAMASYGICIGVLASIDTPMVQVTPTEVKMVATGTKTASKKDMINWANTLYPEADWLTKKVHGVITLVDKNEHIADAIAAMHAGVKTDQFKGMLSAFRAARK